MAEAKPTRQTRSPRSTSSPRAGRRAPQPDRTAHKPRRPFTVDHFRSYARLLILDTGLAWEVEEFQLDVVDDVFAGAPEVWDIVPEGNGKTTLMGGFALYHADYTPDAAVLLAASSRDQCGILLGQAAGFVYRSPGFNRRRFRVFEGHRRIEALRTGGRIQVYAADDRTGDGVIFTLALIDELHRHRDMRLYRTWAGKLEKRGGQIVVISTAGEPGGEFEETIASARKTGERTDTRDGHERIVAEEMVLHRWAVPDDGDVDDLKQVKRANPFSGVSIESLARKRARPSMTPAHWRRFTCNQPARGDDAAINAQEWANAETGDRPEPGEQIFGVGIDLGWTWDTTAIVPLWVPSAKRRVLLAPTIIVPPRDGTSTPPSRVQEAVRAVHQEHPFEVVAIDHAAGGEQLGEWLEQELGCEVIVYTNGNQEQARCAQRFYEGLRAEPEPSLQHTGDELLTRHVLNARARILPRGEPIFDRPVHSRSAPTQDQRVIDALSAAQIIHDAAISGRDTRKPINLDDYRIRRF
jgi:phage terminase large subunit-like protein